MELTINLWGSLLEILLINLILSGDNAVVIAMATLHLEDKDRRKGIFWGTFGAVTLRIILTAGAVILLTLPYIQALGGLFLLWIALKLLKGEENEHIEDSQAPYKLQEAIKTIIIADLLMSLDNVLAVAGAAGGNMLLLMLGLAISIPIVIFGSTFLSSLMKRWSWLISVGSGLLGYTAGEMILKDPACQFLAQIHLLEQGLPWVLAVGVVIGGILSIINKKLSLFQQSKEEDDLLQEGFVQVISIRENKSKKKD